METYPVDLDAGQIVRWILAEQREAPSTFRISASRTTEVRDIPLRKELRLGDEEREDLTEVATVATREIEPYHSEEGWKLTIVAEDEAAPRAPTTRPPGVMQSTRDEKWVSNARGVPSPSKRERSGGSNGPRQQDERPTALASESARRPRPDGSDVARFRLVNRRLSREPEAPSRCAAAAAVRETRTTITRG
jgi:hypothetical protein